MAYLAHKSAQRRILILTRWSGHHGGAQWSRTGLRGRGVLVWGWCCGGGNKRGRGSNSWQLTCSYLCRKWIGEFLILLEQNKIWIRIICVKILLLFPHLHFGSDVGRAVLGRPLPDPWHLLGQGGRALRSSQRGAGRQLGVRLHVGALGEAERRGLCRARLNLRRQDGWREDGDCREGQDASVCLDCCQQMPEGNIRCLDANFQGAGSVFGWSAVENSCPPQRKVQTLRVATTKTANWIHL